MMNFTILDKKEKKLYVLSILFWICMWQILSSFVNQEILLVSPISVLIQLFHMIQIKETWMIMIHSTIGIMVGFFGAFFLGCFLAFLSYQFQIIKIWIAPVILTMKSIPVASFIILLFLFISSKWLPITIVFFMVLPIVYGNVLQGFFSLNTQLLEVVNIFHVTKVKKWRYLYSSEIFPYIKTSCFLGVGFAWKSGVAAEVIGMCQGTIGQALYESKIYFDTTLLFAWTIIILLISFLWEKLIKQLLEQIEIYLLSPNKKVKYNVKTSVNDSEKSREIKIENITKKYKDQVVLEQYNGKILMPSITAIEGKSGIGKTTLIRCIMGIESVNTGRIIGIKNIRFSVVFQENGLCENLSVLSNIQLVANQTITHIKEELKKVGLFDIENKKVKELSGGMKRRIAIVRALQVPFDILVLDEPFQGLDRQLKEQVIAYIKEKIKGKTVLIVSHDKEELEIIGVENKVFLEKKDVMIDKNI